MVSSYITSKSMVGAFTLFVTCLSTSVTLRPLLGNSIPSHTVLFCKVCWSASLLHYSDTLRTNSALCSTLQAGMWPSVVNVCMSSTQDRAIHNIMIEVFCNILLLSNLMPLQTLSSLSSLLFVCACGGKCGVNVCVCTYMSL